MKTCICTLALIIATPAFAQHSHQDHAAAPQAAAPYKGLQERTIKALSDEQIADLRAGKGMSFALPAELNGYPGPLHAVELATQLGLSAEQKQTAQKLADQMRTDAKSLGEQVIVSERELDRLFKGGSANQASVQEATAKAARVQGQLRAAHLQTHVKMMALLTPDQVAKYNKLRGYH